MKSTNAMRRTYASIKSDILLIDQMNTLNDWDTAGALGGDVDDTTELNTTVFVSGGASVQMNKVHDDGTGAAFMRTFDQPFDIADYMGGYIEVWIRSDMTPNKIQKIGFGFADSENSLAAIVTYLNTPVLEEDVFTRVRIPIPSIARSACNIRHIDTIAVILETTNNTDIGYILLNELRLIAPTNIDVANQSATRSIVDLDSAGLIYVLGDQENGVIRKITVVNNDAAIAYGQIFFKDSNNVTLGTDIPDFVFSVAGNATETIDLDFLATVNGFSLAITTTPTGSTAMTTEPHVFVLINDR